MILIYKKLIEMENRQVYMIINSMVKYHFLIFILLGAICGLIRWGTISVQKLARTLHLWNAGKTNHKTFNLLSCKIIYQINLLDLGFEKCWNGWWNFLLWWGWHHKSSLISERVWGIAAVSYWTQCKREKCKNLISPITLFFRWKNISMR